ncbi:MAG: DNA-3-methyladenine glycosylase I [Chthoniobacteraceae bacterium]
MPVHDDIHFFEKLILDGAQAGLSWLTILKKREGYREAYRGFDPAIVARYGDQEAAKLLLNPGIVRNRAKIAASIGNARAFLKIQEEFGSFDAYVWRFVDGSPLQHNLHTMKDYLSKSLESDALSKDLLQRGMKFVGTTIVYAFMQAAGLINDHVVTCHRHAAVAKMK